MQKAQALAVPLLLLAMTGFFVYPLAMRQATASQPLTATLQWVKQVDAATGSRVVQISIGGEDNWQSSKSQAVVLTSRPEIIVVSLKDGSVIYASGKFKPPTPFGPNTFQFVGTDGKVLVWMDRSGPSLHIFATKGGSATVALNYISNPEPTVLGLGQNHDFVVIGDAKGYVALYSISGDD